MADVEQPVVPAAEDIKAKSEPKTEEKENTLTNGNHQESPPKNLDEKIIRQIEYYFGDINYPRDKFLQEESKKDDGWISMETMLLFKRLAKLSEDPKVIVEAIKKSTRQLVEVNEDGSKIRRSPNVPLPELCEDRRKELVSRSIYCKGFPKTDMNIDILLDYFEQYGPLDNLIMRNYLDKAEKQWKFKGSVYAIFPTVEKAAEFLKIENVKYKDEVLERKWQQEHIDEKKKERDQRSKKSTEQDILKKLKEKEDEPPAPVLPKGAFLRLNSCSNDIKREDMKEVLEQKGAKVGFIDYSVGDETAVVRLQGEGTAKKVLEAFEGNVVEVKGVKLEASVIEGEEEEQLIAKSLADLSKRRAMMANKKRNKGGKGRKSQSKRGGPRGGKRRRGNRDDDDDDDDDNDDDENDASEGGNDKNQKRKNEDTETAAETPAKKERTE
ncbi:unnamed protein product [Bemisia tabaci]|uniref:La protein n=2 Tax=Bemisia tabaci TaxID=7038 RepID=A0A9P0F5E0_BEMTA|nr:unnamed protein product [Bemisia tabaci]